jgi:hypothetical protein
VTGGDVVVHYSAINTTALAAPVAQRLGVKPRGSHALILLGPRRTGADASARESVQAVASGTVRRLTGQRQTLNFRSVDTGSGRDLIAEFEIQDGETLAFDVGVLPQGASYPLVIRFQQQFYRD